MKTRQIHGLGLGEFLIFAPAKEMLKSAYFFSALEFFRWIFFVIRLRFERRTHSLEGCCSIQLSYRTIFFKSVAKVRQFIENSNNLPKFFIRKSIFPSFRL